MLSRTVKAYLLIVTGALLLLAGGALTFPMVGPLSVAPEWASPWFDKVRGPRPLPGGYFLFIEFVVACMPGALLLALGLGLRGPPPRPPAAEGDYRAALRDYEKQHPGASAHRAAAPPPNRPDPDR
jgi:hypothetical protein